MSVAVPKLFPRHIILLFISLSSSIYFFCSPNLSHTFVYFTLNYITNDWPVCRHCSLSLFFFSFYSSSFFFITQKKKKKNEVERNSTIHFLFLSLVHLYCRFYVFALMSGQCTRKRMTEQLDVGQPMKSYQIQPSKERKKEKKKEKNQMCTGNNYRCWWVVDMCMNAPECECTDV